MTCPPPTGRLRPAHVLYVSVRPAPDVQVRRTSRPHLNLQRRGLHYTPITLSLQKSHEELRTARTALLLTLCMIRSSLLFFFPLLAVRRINEDISFGVYLVGKDFPM